MTSKFVSGMWWYHLQLPPSIPPHGPGFKKISSDYLGGVFGLYQYIWLIIKTILDFIGFEYGGRGRNRTDDRGFAVPCITTLLPSLKRMRDAPMVTHATQMWKQSLTVFAGLMQIKKAQLGISCAFL